MLQSVHKILINHTLLIKETMFVYEIRIEAFLAANIIQMFSGYQPGEVRR